jgi:hypothetical protein
MGKMDRYGKAEVVRDTRAARSDFCFKNEVFEAVQSAKVKRQKFGLRIF